ncbi:hypothetical protein NDU88_006181 [Pleurodeles waltl]|uniref:Uncharacterized protein n=1 Tax=Pleurodeles waltl TaxID=8319 RepID=A0AAV7MCJ9_PLEWA|nr:hypothetical protein NDU88_006181 [Pleurodeles waltl]
MTCLRHGRKAGGYWAAQNGRSRQSQSCGDRSISALGVARSPSEEISALSTGLPKHQTVVPLEPEVLVVLDKDDVTQGKGKRMDINSRLSVVNLLQSMSLGSVYHVVYLSLVRLVVESLVGSDP